MNMILIKVKNQVDGYGTTQQTLGDKTRRDMKMKFCKIMAVPILVYASKMCMKTGKLKEMYKNV